MDRAVAYSEVYEILNLMGKEYKDKIPSKLMQIIIDEMDKDYKPNIDIKKPLKEQNLKQRTFDILGMIKLNYWCENEIEKKEFLNKISENDKKRQEEIREKYNPDNIFKNNSNIVKENVVTEEVALVKVEDSKWYNKVFQFFRSLFKKILVIK